MPLEGLSKRLKMHKNLKWIIHNFHFILSKHKSYTFKWRYETKDLIFVFKIHYLYIKLGLICIETEWNGLNIIPMLLVLYHWGRLAAVAIRPCATFSFKSWGAFKGNARRGRVNRTSLVQYGIRAAFDYWGFDLSSVNGLVFVCRREE